MMNYVIRQIVPVVASIAAYKDFSKTMSQLHLITLRCKETGETYVTRANRKRRASFTNKNFKLKLKKYSAKLRKHVMFAETKKMFGKK